MAEEENWADIDKENERVHNRLNALKAGSSLTKDQAFGQYSDFLTGLGGKLDESTTGDFENLWRQSAEASDFGGAGLDKANSFASNFAGFQPRLVQRWQGEAGEPDPTQENWAELSKRYPYYGGDGSGDDDEEDTVNQWTTPNPPEPPPTGPVDPYIPPEEPVTPVTPVTPVPPVEPVVDPNIERIRTMLAESQARDKARSDALWAQLSGQAQQGLDVDRNDPTIRAQADAYAANEQRSANDYMADLAEGSSPYTNMLGEQRLSAERIGQRTGGFEAELMGRELQARRDEIAQALAGQGAMLTADQQRSLTQELALMDNAIKEKQLAADQGLGYARLGLDTELGRGDLSLRGELGRGGLAVDQGRLGLDTELGRGQLSLSQQELKQRWDEAMLRNEQFRQQLGFDTSRFASDDDYRRSYY